MLLVARQVVVSRRADSRGIENSVLLDVASRYLDLLGAQAALDAIRRSEGNMRQIVEATAAFGGPGRGASAITTGANAGPALALA